MFMRCRSHTCQYCATIDEAHFQRHKKIAELIRRVYDSCGFTDWTILRSEPAERSQASDDATIWAARNGIVSGSISEPKPLSKREKKDAKNLIRAANRPQIISNEEIFYVEAVIHPAEGILGDDNDGPSNTDEMEEIERHLKYNAHVYNSQGNQRALKKFARMPEVDVDFDSEMNRILEAFRITDLLNRNTRNRGLQGKELKGFHTTVDELKKDIVNDLVLVKREILEIRMRRAGYLRYTHKTGHSILEERYIDKDWKMGGKHILTTSDSSDIVSPSSSEMDSASPE
jgi:hypothetical protein